MQNELVRTDGAEPITVKIGAQPTAAEMITDPVPESVLYEITIEPAGLWGEPQSREQLRLTWAELPIRH